MSQQDESQVSIFFENNNNVVSPSKSDVESTNIFDILEKFTDKIENLQRLNVNLQLKHRKKTSADDPNSGAIRNPECEILVKQSKVSQQINEY